MSAALELLMWLVVGGGCCLMVYHVGWVVWSITYGPKECGQYRCHCYHGLAPFIADAEPDAYCRRRVIYSRECCRCGYIDRG
jgi:hypothetical protein